MKQYFIEDNSTQEVKEITSKAEFYERLVYNLDVSVDYEDRTTLEALQLLDGIHRLDDLNCECDEIVNGFTYIIKIN